VGERDAAGFGCFRHDGPSGFFILCSRKLITVAGCKMHSTMKKSSTNSGGNLRREGEACDMMFVGGTTRQDGFTLELYQIDF
jgi:hypothetical protein